MRMRKTYVDNMWHQLKTKKIIMSVLYMSWCSVVIKQWFVHELYGGEQTYVQCVYVKNILTFIIVTVAICQYNLL